MYLTFKVTPEFTRVFTSFALQETSQQGGYAPLNPIPGRPTNYAEGMVEELILISPGAGYPPNSTTLANIQTTVETDVDITTQDSLEIQTDAGGNLIYQTTGSGKGSGLTVVIGQQRTTKNGITSVSIYNT